MSMSADVSLAVIASIGQAFDLIGCIARHGAAVAVDGAQIAGMRVFAYQVMATLR